VESRCGGTQGSLGVEVGGKERTNRVGRISDEDCSPFENMLQWFVEINFVVSDEVCPAVAHKTVSNISGSELLGVETRLPQNVNDIRMKVLEFFKHFPSGFCLICLCYWLADIFNNWRRGISPPRGSSSGPSKYPASKSCNEPLENISDAILAT
jgi:hypothetical protein